MLRKLNQAQQVILNRIKNKQNIVENEFSELLGNVLEPEIYQELLAIFRRWSDGIKSSTFMPMIIEYVETDRLDEFLFKQKVLNNDGVCSVQDEGGHAGSGFWREGANWDDDLSDKSRHPPVIGFWDTRANW